MIELAPGVHVLGEKSGGHVHAYLLETGGELTLVDTLFEGDGHLVLDAIRALGRSPTDLKRIAITHGHRSHLGGLAALKRASGATVHAHVWEADIVAGNRRAQAVSILPRRPLKTFPYRIGLWLDYPRHKACPVDELVDDADAIGPLEVLHAPGHTPGHLGFWWAERGFLIAGDGVATWPSLGPGWRSFNLNVPQHRVSLDRFAALEPKLVGVGHGDPVTKDATDTIHRVRGELG